MYIWEYKNINSFPLAVNALGEDIEATVITGKVIRPLRSVDPSQTEYQGLIEVIEEGRCLNADGSMLLTALASRSIVLPLFFVSGGSKGQKIPFGIMSMASKADCLQKGEPVKFQVCTLAQTGQKMACIVVPQRRALVECVKDQVPIACLPCVALIPPSANCICQVEISFLWICLRSLASSHMKLVKARNCSSTWKKYKTVWSSRLVMKWSSQLSSISAQENSVPATYAESGTDSGNQWRILGSGLLLFHMHHMTETSQENVYFFLTMFLSQRGAQTCCYTTSWTFGEEIEERYSWWCKCSSLDCFEAASWSGQYKGTTALGKPNWKITFCILTVSSLKQWKWFPGLETDLEFVSSRASVWSGRCASLVSSTEQ